jgi:hypothetical protein
MPNRRRRRPGRHAARRPFRHLVLLILGLALGAGTAALFDSPLLGATPTAAQPDLTAADLDPQRSAAQGGVSRDHTRSASPAPSAPSPSPSVSPAAPAPPKPVAPVAGLTRAQMDNAATIVEVTRRRNLSRQAAVVAVATALQESNLYNVASTAVPESLKYPHEGVSVNYDSVGLFQQRASQGWGTVAQLMDPRYATGVFYDRLLKVSGWESMSVTGAAQAVQRSAYPGAYQKHESTARQAVAALMP